MLSGESAVGSYAEKALSVLCMASGRMELWSREENRQNLLFLPQLAETLSDQIAEQTCNCAVEMGMSFASLCSSNVFYSRLQEIDFVLVRIQQILFHIYKPRVAGFSHGTTNYRVLFSFTCMP